MVVEGLGWSKGRLHTNLEAFAVFFRRKISSFAGSHGICGLCCRVRKCAKPFGC